MENGTGIEATKEIVDNSNECKIIILTSYYDDEQVFPAIEAGAFSYLLKTSSAADIIDAIKKAMTGENVLAPKVASKMIAGYRSNQPMRSEERRVGKEHRSKLTA